MANGEGGKGKAFEATRSGDGGPNQEKAVVYSDADLSKPGNFQVADKGTAKPAEKLSAEEQYVRKAPKELREEIGIPANSTSEQLFHAMSKRFMDAIKEASPMLVREAERETGLKRKDMNEQSVFDAIVAREKRDGRLTPNATYEQTERAMHRKHFRMPVRDDVD